MSLSGRFGRHPALGILGLRGVRRLVASFGCGALCACAHSPWLLTPGLLVGTTILVWLLDSSRAESTSAYRAARGGFAVLYVFGAGYFLVGLWWLSEAFHVPGAFPSWLRPLSPLATLGVALVLALPWGVAGSVASLGWRPGFSRLALLAAVFGLAEAVRGNLFGGFPWLAPAYAATAVSDAFSQGAAFVGIYGLSAATIFFASLPSASLGPRGEWSGLREFLFGFSALLVLWSAGSFRLSAADVPPSVSSSSSPLIRLVQPNLSQGEKWLPERRREWLELHLNLSRRVSPEAPRGLDDVDLVVWPESSPFPFSAGSEARIAVASLLPSHGALLAGALIRESDGRLYNSLLALDSRGRVVDRYDKIRLVPFGERLPLSDFLVPLLPRVLRDLAGGFSSGDESRPLRLSGRPSPFPLICYEAAFPNASAMRGADWILNVTNDAWFGESRGPWQHFEHARLRAVESGLSLVRSANTGISAVIDPYGRVIARLGSGRRGVLDVILPRSLASSTFYSRFGDVPSVVLMVLAVLFLSRRRT